MSYKTFVSMNIAIIGNEEIAEEYIVGYTMAGHELYLASLDEGKQHVNSSYEALESVHICSIAEAAEAADLIIIATPPKDVREVSYWLGDVRRKVIIDATCNVHAPDDELVKTICAIKAITGSPHVVKTFHTKGYEHILKPLFKTAKVEVILAGDSLKAKEITRIMAKELGINHCYDFGGNETFPLFNEMTKCWRNLVAKNPAPNEVKRQVAR